MKIAIAQIKTDPGDIEGNTKKIIEYITKAKNTQVELVVFPELAIPGYMSLDLVYFEKYIQKNLEALHEIVQHTQGISAIVGFIDQDPKTLGSDGMPIRFNAAAVIQDKKILLIQDKTLLPDYDVFFETRYFSPARDRKIVALNGEKIGLEICEDMWDDLYPIKVSEELVKKGSDLLVNVSGSPFYVGKRFVREALIQKHVKKYKVPFVYANLVGGQDGYEGELVFDGQSMVFNAKGELIALGKAFEEELIVVDVDSAKPIQLVPYDEAQELHDALVMGIRDYFRRCGFSKALIGVSGGIDSALVASLAVAALGKEHVKGIFMPTRYSSSTSREDAEQLAKNLDIAFSIVPIETVFKDFEMALSEEFKGKEKDVTEENMQARIRGTILMAESNKFKALVISTGNKTETALGYTTLYGDMCGGLAAISDVNKLRVYALAQLINKKAGREIIPKRILDKKPTAELADNQTDEGSLGAPYSIMSPLVDEIVEEGKTRDALSKNYPPAVVEKLMRLVHLAEYKRRQAPPGIKVTKKAFGIGRRIPISHPFRN